MPDSSQSTKLDQPEQLTFLVESMSCSHCENAVAREVSQIDGVTSVEVDLDRKLVTVRGKGLRDVAVRAAIEEAGYEAAAT